MTSLANLTENSSIANFTVAELENLVTKIVTKTITQNAYDQDHKTFDSTAKPISEIAAELAAQIPDEEWAFLPPNASELVDEYL